MQPSMAVAVSRALGSNADGDGTLGWIPQGSSLSFQPAPVCVSKGSTHQCAGFAWPGVGSEWEGECRHGR